MTAKNEIELSKLLQDLWRGRWIVVATTGAGVVLAAIFAFTQADIYRAEALVAPNHDQAGGLSAIEAQYGGLANLAGIDLDDQGVDKTERGLEILQSSEFVSGFI